MKTFTDNAGREWQVAINVASLKRAKSLAGVDLNTVLDGGDLLGRLMGDACLLGDVLWAVCAQDAERKNVNQADFQTALGGDSLDRGMEALLAELVGFTRNPRDRERMSRLLGKMDNWFQVARDLMDSRMQNADAVFERAFKEAVQQADAALNSPPPSPGDSSTKPPESAESIPAPSPSRS
jgi:hypothetical protein